MVNWHSLKELATDTVAFQNLVHSLLGLYLWEFVTSLDFDWDIIKGKKKFRWPLVFYFAGRYLLLFSMIGIAIAIDTKNPSMDCQALYTFNQLAGNSAVGLASINLSLRTIALWNQKGTIIALLLLIILGHWSLILQGELLQAEYVHGSGCVITKTNNTVLAAIFIYSMGFDFTVLMLRRRGKLVTMLFKDGLIYFIIAFLSNLVATIFMVLDLNPIMNIIFNVPAAVASTIVACRVVRRLANFTHQDSDAL
ncbi:hypothetical protein PUNSTDRAFT_113901 [Punctularia strigosozonata HHB-11173 SS5]|uniref:uncharacterized protein n=1 Tax=Punctularia strigosozonata (strain HHB-11173) TaxID=741275 RepID=UPI0004417DFD|nr:uncharacterized protein PUNSTDRAFT_113901 [Punctularia strigosozonata HHB-11173 SS5]EIN08351.1 hypothetical protein PUNSTDRAFT_113901 [Punctularia strigosozonata HHB-11173 SS5]